MEDVRRLAGRPRAFGDTIAVFAHERARRRCSRRWPLDPVALAIFWTTAPVVVAPPPTDAKVIAGTILGIAGMAINASMYRRHW